MDSEIVDFPVPSVCQESAIYLQAVFDSFDEFFESYSQWMENGYHPFTVQKSHACRDPRIKFIRVRYACVHRGIPTYRGKGKRPNQTYLGQDCPAFLSIKHDKSLDKILVRELNDQHNHDIGPEIYQTYRQNRRLSREEMNKAKQLIETNATPDLVAKAISQFSGKVVSKKDVYNLQNRLKNEEEKPSRRHYRTDVPSRGLLCQEYEDEVTIISELSDEPELPARKNGTRKRKTAEESALQSLLESSLSEVANHKSDMLSSPSIGVGDTDPFEAVEVTISSSVPSTSSLKRSKTLPVICVNPLGTKLNLTRLHKQHCSDLASHGAEDLTISSRGRAVFASMKPTSNNAKRGQLVFVERDSGAAAVHLPPIAESEAEPLPKSMRKPRKAPKRTIVQKPRHVQKILPKADGLPDVLIDGFLRVCPVRQLNLFSQVCRSWRDQIADALVLRQKPVWVMQHTPIKRDTKLEDLFREFQASLQHLSFEPRFVLSFISASLFRPQFEPSNGRINPISTLKELLPKQAQLCEIYGVGIIGTENLHKKTSLLLEPSSVAETQVLLPVIVPLPKDNYPSTQADECVIPIDATSSSMSASLLKQEYEIIGTPEDINSIRVLAMLSPDAPMCDVHYQIIPAQAGTGNVGDIPVLLPVLMSTSSVPHAGYQIIQAQECNITAGLSALLLPSMRNAIPVCMVLDGKRLREMEATQLIPSYISDVFGLSRPPLKSLLLFEHGSPSPVAVNKFYDYLLETHPAGFSCIGAEVCQSKVDTSIYMTEQPWGPTLIAVGFLGDFVVSSSLYLTEAECADPTISSTLLTDWRERLSKSTFAQTMNYSLVHFCFVFYSEQAQEGISPQSEPSPNILFAAIFKDVPLLGVQAYGNLYGYTMDVTNLTEDLRKEAKNIMKNKSEHACAFCIVSVPNV